jgi:hypothetical protein
MTGEEIAHPTSRTVSMAELFSVERVLYGMAVVIGFWLRVWYLDAQPLSPWEASNSWPAWLVAHALSVEDTPSPTSALFYSLQWLLFWTGVNSDAGARFVSAVAGALLVVLPWWWREFLGRRVALLLVFLLAIDPWLLGFGRLADGAGLALTLGLLSLVALGQVAMQQDNLAWKRTAAISMGLMLVSGPMGWNLLPVVLWWGWLLADKLKSAGLIHRQWLLWGAGSAILGATMSFARLDAMAWIASGMSVWLTQFDGRSAGPLLPLVTGGYDFGWPWLRLWVDAPLLLPLGIGGLGVLLWRARREPGLDDGVRSVLSLCLGWLLWGVLLWLLPGRSPLALPMLGLPLLILSAFSFDTLLATIPRDVDWREMGAVVLTLTILFVSGILWLAALLASRSYDPVLAQAALVIFGLALAILVAFAFWANRRDAAWLAAALLSTMLLVFFVRSSWKLNFGDMQTEPSGWQATMAHPEVRLLVDDMETLSAHRSGDPYQLPVQVQIASYVTPDDRVIPARPDPVVGWELRNMRNLTWVNAPQVSEETNPLPLVVTPAISDEQEAQMALPESYAGSRYDVTGWWLPRTLSQPQVVPAGEMDGLQRLVQTMQPWWRWFIYRESTVPPQNREVILWAPVESNVP